LELALYLVLVEGMVHNLNVGKYMCLANDYLNTMKKVPNPPAFNMMDFRSREIGNRAPSFLLGSILVNFAGLRATENILIGRLAFGQVRYVEIGESGLFDQPKTVLPLLGLVERDTGISRILWNQSQLGCLHEGCGKDSTAL
jgi:hypothetical protein